MFVFLLDGIIIYNTYIKAKWTVFLGDLRSHEFGSVLRANAQRPVAGDLAQSARRVPRRDGRQTAVRHTTNRTGLQTRVLRRSNVAVVVRAVRVASGGLSAPSGRVPDASLRARGQLRGLIRAEDTTDNTTKYIHCGRRRREQRTADEDDTLFLFGMRAIGRIGNTRTPPIILLVCLLYP